MIISHRHRYVFVELPRTGSSAVRRELRELYDGVPILHKHSTYDEFRRQASEDERGYFVFRYRGRRSSRLAAISSSAPFATRSTTP